LTEGRKEVISTIIRTLQRGTYPAYPFLRNSAGDPRGKNPQNPNYKGTRDKTLTKTNSRCINLNTA
jgi:hypothetical protein